MREGKRGERERERGRLEDTEGEEFKGMVMLF